MTTQAELDLQARLADMERQLAELAAKVNPLYGGGMDRYIHSGYLQFDGIPFRWGTKGMQVQTDGAEVRGIYFVDKLVTDPSDPNLTLTVGSVLGLTDAGRSISILEAKERLNNNVALARVACYGIDSGDDHSLASVLISAVSAEGISPYPYIEVAHERDYSRVRVYNTTLGLPQLASLDADMFQGAGAIYYNTTDAKPYININGTWTAIGGGMSLIVKEADETVNNSNTLQDDNELLFAVAANEVWQFEGVLLVDTGTTPDFKLTFTGPTGAVGAFGVRLSTNQIEASVHKSVELGSAVNAAAMIGAAEVVRFWGGIHNGANAGNLTLQWAQNTADASDTKVLAGSYIKYMKET